MKKLEGIRLEDIRGLSGKRKCHNPEGHMAYEEPGLFGELQVAESLDPKDVIWYQSCGLCGRFLWAVEPTKEERS